MYKMRNVKSVTKFLIDKIDDLKEQYHVSDVNVFLSNKKRLGTGDIGYCLLCDKHNEYLGNMYIGVKGLHFMGVVSDANVITALISIHHEFRHVEQFQRMRNDSNPYYGLMLNSLMSEYVCINKQTKSNDYYVNNYKYNSREIDAIYYSLQRTYVDLLEFTDDTFAEKLVLDFVNRQAKTN